MTKCHIPKGLRCIRNLLSHFKIQPQNGDYASTCRIYKSSTRTWLGWMLCQNFGNRLFSHSVEWCGMKGMLQTIFSTGNFKYTFYLLFIYSCTKMFNGILVNLFYKLLRAKMFRQLRI